MLLDATARLLLLLPPVACNGLMLLLHLLPLSPCFLPWLDAAAAAAWTWMNG